MHTLGKFVSAQKSSEGTLLTFAVAEEDFPEDLMDAELALEIEKYSEKRSLSANAYFWKLCTLIAQKLGSDKDTIYLLQLAKYGVFKDITILTIALDDLKRIYRYVEELDHNDEYTQARCYIGSSRYDKQEMRLLIEGTVNDAHDLGISTWSDEEVERLVSRWKSEI